MGQLELFIILDNITTAIDLMCLSTFGDDIISNFLFYSNLITCKKSFCDLHIQFPFWNCSIFTHLFCMILGFISRVI